MASVEKARREAATAKVKLREVTRSRTKEIVKLNRQQKETDKARAAVKFWEKKLAAATRAVRAMNKKAMAENAKMVR